MEQENKNSATLFSRIRELASTLGTKGFENTPYGSAQNFSDYMAYNMGSIVGHVDDVVKLRAADAAVFGTLRGTEYQDHMEPYHKACFHSLECAGMAIDSMNRMFKDAGLEPFAEIPGRDNADRGRAVSQVCGRLALETNMKEAGEEAGLNGYGKAVSQGQPSSPYSAKMQEMMRGLGRGKNDAGMGHAGPEVGA